MQIDHINIKAPGPVLEDVRDFYCAVLGLEEGFRPNFRDAGIWLYADGQPIVHLSFGEVSAVPGASSHLDHVAFLSSGLEAFLVRLDRREVAYRSSYVPELNITQLRFRDPVGTGLEINFPGEVMP